MNRYTNFEGSAKKRAANKFGPSYTLKDLAEKTGVSISTIKSRSTITESERVGIKMPSPSLTCRNKRMYSLAELIEWHNKWQERVGGALL